MEPFFGGRVEWPPSHNPRPFNRDIVSLYPTTHERENPMAKNSSRTDLVPSANTNGEDTRALMAEHLDETFSTFLQSPDVALVDTILCGDPSDGKLPAYIGELIGPGRSIEIADIKTGEIRQLPTWTFHPMLKDGVVRNVTHVIPSSHQLNADFGRIYDRCKTEGLVATIGVRYMGKERTRKGNQVNNYQVFERFAKA